MAEVSWVYDLEGAKIDRRPILLTVRIPRDLEDIVLAAEGYWHAEEKSFWWANEAPGDYTAEAIPEGNIIAWAPMPLPAQPKEQDNGQTET